MNKDVNFKAISDDVVYSLRGIEDKIKVLNLYLDNKISLSKIDNIISEVKTKINKGHIQMDLFSKDVILDNRHNRSKAAIYTMLHYEKKALSKDYKNEYEDELDRLFPDETYDCDYDKQGNLLLWHKEDKDYMLSEEQRRVLTLFNERARDINRMNRIIWGADKGIYLDDLILLHYNIYNNADMTYSESKYGGKSRLNDIEKEAIAAIHIIAKQRMHDYVQEEISKLNNKQIKQN